MLRCLAVSITALAFLGAACSEEATPVKDKPEPSARTKATTPSTDPAPAPAPAPPPSNEPATVNLDKLGYSIDVPGTWTMKELSAEVVTFRIPGGEQQAGALIPFRLDVRQQLKAPKNAAAAAKACPADVIDTQKDDAGRFYYVCKQTAVGRTVQTFQYVIPSASKQPAVICSGSGARVDDLLAACKTLAKL